MNLNFLIEKFLVSKEIFDKPIIVTGAGGCIGSWVLSILYRSKVPCLAIDLSIEKTRAKLILGDEVSNIPWEKCDITDYTSLKNIISDYQAGAIIHLAGLQVPFCAANPSLGARVNVEGTVNILQIAREMNIKRTVYASSVAALGMPPKGSFKETLYGAYKQANEHSAYVFWSDWKVPSIGIRPNVVYGLARDQGVSSKNTIAIQAAVLEKKYDVPYTGDYNWLYAGEAAAAFIASIKKDIEGAPVFNLNGSSETIENSLHIIKSLHPQANISCSGTQFPFPTDLDDTPLRNHIGNYPSINVKEGITQTFKAFQILKENGNCPEMPTD